MRKMTVFAGFFVSFMSAGICFAQNRAWTTPEDIVKLSKEIKAYEKSVYRIDPGKFGTKSQKEVEKVEFDVFAQPSCDLSRPIMAMTDEWRRADQQSLSCIKRKLREAGYDVYASQSVNSDQTKISISFFRRVETDATALAVIFHEDFHNSHRGKFYDLGIEESFALPYAYYAARRYAKEVLKQPDLAEAISKELGARRIFMRIVRETHAEADQLYKTYECATMRKSTLSGEKIVVLKNSPGDGECHADQLVQTKTALFVKMKNDLRESASVLHIELPDELNNAYLMVMTTYAEHFEAAETFLREHGPMAFVQAYNKACCQLLESPENLLVRMQRELPAAMRTLGR